MPLRVSLKFQATTAPVNRNAAAARTGGWSENFWTAGPRTDLVTDIRAVAQARARLLPVQASIIGYEIQAFDIQGNKLLPGGSSSAKLLYPGNASFTADVLQAALEVTASYTGFQNVFRHTLRGFPDELVENGEYTGASDARVMTFMGTLTRFGGVYRDLNQQAFRVLGIAAGVITLLNPAGLAVNDFLILRRVKDINGKPVSGSFRITAIAGSAFTVALLDPTIVAQTGGTARKDLLISIYDPQLPSIGPIRVKKVGNPSDRYRGRRSKRRV